MPSPVDSTRPVSRTSTSRWYSWIWRLMMSLISAARISIPSVPPWRVVRRPVPAGRRRAITRRGSALEQRATPGDTIGERLQLGADAAVVDGSLDVDDDAAEQLRIDRRFRQHRAAELALEGRDQGLAVRVVERHGRRD